MGDVPEEFEATDKLGSTSQFDGTVGLSPIDIPASPAEEIAEFIVQCPYDQVDTNSLKISVNGGSDYLTIQPAGYWAWSPKGGVTQLTLLGNVAGVKYEVVLNKELS